MTVRNHIDLHNNMLIEGGGIIAHPMQERVTVNNEEVLIETVKT